MWGLRWGRRSKSGKIDRLPSCVGWRGGKPRAGLRHGFTPLLDGTNRAEAARLAGMERQALRDAVLRYNTEDLAGLRDRPKGRPQRRVTEGEGAAMATVILRGPEPDRAMTARSILQPAEQAGRAADWLCFTAATSASP